MLPNHIHYSHTVRQVTSHSENVAVTVDLMFSLNMFQWHIDSAAIGDWHVGGGPDNRTMRCLRKHNVEYNHTVRQVKLVISTCFLHRNCVVKCNL